MQTQCSQMGWDFATVIKSMLYTATLDIKLAQKSTVASSTDMLPELCKKLHRRDMCQVILGETSCFL
jgi:hypothetical protein